MKRLFRILSVACMITAMIVSSMYVSSAASKNYIKVGLEYGSSAPDSITISSDDGLVLYNVADGSFEKDSKVLDKYDTVILVNKNSEVKVTDSSGSTITTLKGNGKECIASADYDSVPVKAGKTVYMGGIIPYLNSDSDMNIINFVDMEDYLKGLLAAEMSSSYDAEALKAQAVAARSFATVKTDAHSSQGFSVCDTTHCQVYGGVSKESEATNKAVDATKGELLYYKGSVVAGYYFSNSGGHTEDSEDVWGSSIGYLRGVSDPYSPDYSWTVKITRDQIYNALSSKGVGAIESVTIDKVNASGYVASMTVTGSRSSYTVTKDSIRSMFGSDYNLKSRMFTIDTKGGTLTAGSSSTIAASGNWYARGSSGTSKLGENIYVLSSSGTYTAKLNGLNILDSSGNRKVASYTAAQTVAGAGMTVTFDDDDDQLIISGKGYGHGVGMSQEGANVMGKKGFDYEEILEYYYTDIEVK